MSRIYEVRLGTLSFGSRPSLVEAQHLLEQSAEHLRAQLAELRARNPDGPWHEDPRSSFSIEEIDTSGCFEIPSLPTPRERYRSRVSPSPDSGVSMRMRVEILEGKKVVASYDRDYPNFYDTFEPFRQGDRAYALIAPSYTATSVIDLRTGEIIASEEPSAGGFCPVGFYVPDWWDVSRPHPQWAPPGSSREDTVIRPGMLPWRDSYEWPTRGDFGFVWGCHWGDEASWKVQYLDLSEIEQGVIRRDDRFGYVKLATSAKLAARDFITISDPRHVRFAVETNFDLVTGREITDDWDPHDDHDDGTEPGLPWQGDRHDL